MFTFTSSFLDIPLLFIKQPANWPIFPLQKKRPPSWVPRRSFAPTMALEPQAPQSWGGMASNPQSCEASEWMCPRWVKSPRFEVLLGGYPKVMVASLEAEEGVKTCALQRLWGPNMKPRWCCFMLSHPNINPKSPKTNGVWGSFDLCFQGDKVIGSQTRLIQTPTNTKRPSMEYHRWHPDQPEPKCPPSHGFGCG